MKKPISVSLVAIAIAFGQAGAIDFNFASRLNDNLPGPPAHARSASEDENIDPCLNAANLARNDHAESLLALSGFGIR